MKLSRILQFFLFLSILLVFPLTGFCKKVDIGPADITLKSLRSAKPAEFPHRMHQGFVPCMKCHHTVDRTMEIGKCHSCHNEEMANEKLNSMKEAGHLLCKGCHKEQRSAGKEIPGRCSTCHPLAIRTPLPSYAK